jgi:predicted P-loop ATPase
MSSNVLVPDFTAATSFLLGFAPGESWCLVAIEPNPPDGQQPRVVAAHFDEHRVAEAHAWLRQHAQSNLYYSANEAAPSCTTTPTKEEITGLRCLHADVDLPNALAAIRALEPRATAIVFSGGGYHPIWRFPANLPESELLRVEAASREISESVTGGDHCWNVNRLLRLPGSVNWLSRAKRARGREPALAYLVEADWSRTWSFETDPVPRAPVVANGHDRDAEPNGNVVTFRPRRTEAAAPLPDKVMKVVKTGDASRWDDDRSRAVFYVATAAVRAGWTDESIAKLLLDPKNGISAHVREQSNPNEYGARQARSARESVAEDWERTERGEISHDSQKNVRRALGQMRVGLRYDVFAGRVEVDGRPLDDAIGNDLRFAISDRFDFRPSKEFFFDYLASLAREDRFHPIRDYLDAVVWDGTPRIGKWLITYLGAEDTEFVRAVGRLTLVAAVTRVFQPGVKFDEMLILVNPRQGLGRSSALAALCPNRRWFTDDLPLGVRSKEVIEKMAGKWIVEVAELAGMSRGSVEQIKAFLSRQVDIARLAWGRLATEVERCWVLIGTTNAEVFLKDAENRRYWPVKVGQIDVAGIDRDRDQLWAEARAAHAAGETIRLAEKLWGDAEEEQEEHALEDPWEYTIAEKLGNIEGRIPTGELFKLLKIPEGVKRPEMGGRLAAIMRRLGWVSSTNKKKNTAIRFANGVVGRGWIKGDDTRTLIAMDDGYGNMSVGECPVVPPWACNASPKENDPY